MSLPTILLIIDLIGAAFCFTFGLDFWMRGDRYRAWQIFGCGVALLLSLKTLYDLPLHPHHMIAEPYICIKGKRIGSIEWFDDGGAPNTCGLQPRKGEHWQPYADFERKKLSDLFGVRDYVLGVQNDGDGLSLLGYRAEDLISYSSSDDFRGSESSRLLKRAEFLKAVCEKEGVEWLPGSVSIEGEPALVANELSERIKSEARDYFTKEDTLRGYPKSRSGA